VSDREWNDWRWQVRRRIQTIEELSRFVRLSAEEGKALELGGAMLPLSVTPYFLSLLDAENPDHALRRTVIPTVYEFQRGPGEADDPLGEEHQSPVPGLVHRYPDRVLLLTLDFCSTYCCYCTRSRVVGHCKLTPSQSRFEQALDYIRRTPTVRDVLLSGGDPLMLGDNRLDWLLTQLRRIPHVEVVRIGTKIPAVLPQRVTPQLTRMLRKHHPLWMSLHFTHPDECTVESRRACAMLADAGIPLGSQTVLLRGINDCPHVMKRLMQRMLMLRVRPYYLYQCDLSQGIEHFRTSVARGIEVIEGLRGHTTGLAVPQFVIDAPGGGGKVPILPQYLISLGEGRAVVRNFEGKICAYSQPEGYRSECPPGCTCCNDAARCSRGVAGLLEGSGAVLGGEEPLAPAPVDVGAFRPSLLVQ